MARSWCYSSRLAFLSRWLVFLSAGLAACGGAPDTGSAAGALASRQLAAATVDNRYQITNLSLEGSSKGFVTPKGINATGQVAGYIMVEGKNRAFMFDGNTMRDLGTLGGENSEAVAISNAGKVAGSTQVADGPYHAFRYDSEGMHDLGAIGGNESRAMDINDEGQVVGTFDTIRPTDQGPRPFGPFAFVHDGGTMFELLTPLELLDRQKMIFPGIARAINAAGQAVGYRLSNTLPSRPLYYDGNVTMRLGESEYNDAYGVAINDAGQFVGAVDSTTDFPRAAIWHAPNTRQIIGLPNESKSIALDINDASQVLGQSWNAAGNSRGFVWMPGGEIADIGNLGGNDTIPVGFNLSGQTVGQSQNANGDWRAFAWTASQGMVDLNTRLRNAPDGLILENALAIADNGSIVALTNEGDLVLLTTAADNHAPVAGSIMSDDVVAVNTPLAFSASFTDADASGTHAAQWNWGDGSPVEAGIVAGSASEGSVSGSHAYSTAGIYTASLTLTDDEGLSAQVSRTVVVYDPKGGVVAGAGRITSPPGAYKAKPTQTGKAEFLFASAYLPGRSAKLGSSTLFHFHAAGMSFITTSADWLVVSGARADYAGTGVLNGKKGYRYQLTAIDGARVGRGAKDRLRMRIWSVDAEGQEVVAYDNQLDPAGGSALDEGSVLSGGQVSILGH